MRDRGTLRRVGQTAASGYHHRSHYKSETAASARRFRSPRERTARSPATEALSQSVAPPSEAMVARSGRALAQGLLDSGVQQTPPPGRTTRSDSHRSPCQTDEFAWDERRRQRSRSPVLAARSTAVLARGSAGEPCGPAPDYSGSESGSCGRPTVVGSARNAAIAWCVCVGRSTWGTCPQSSSR